jgi:ribosomal protein S18 acetylase RimI-like enzyme
VTWNIRRAGLEDGDEIAVLYRRVAGREWDFLYPHTPAEDRGHFRKALEKGPVWVAVEAGRIVGFIATRRGWIDHFYVAHERQGRGIGQALIARAMKGRSHVRLWTFQVNARSRAFYRAQGFVEARFTDGADNEEREPDVMLEWRRR